MAGRKPLVLGDDNRLRELPAGDHVLSEGLRVLTTADVPPGVWHPGNDGAGSGLDADLLDGQHGTFYRNAGNINAGTLPVARGGTGQTTLQATRSAMGLGNTTGALPVANGGTGATNATQARTNLGLGTAATRAVPASGNATATQVVLGNDSRLAGNIPFSTATHQSIHLTANTHNFALNADTRVLRTLSNNDAHWLTGLAGGTRGRMVLLVNAQQQLTLMHNNVSSLAVNRFLCPGSTSFVLRPNGCVWLYYDGFGNNMWRVVAP